MSFGVVAIGESLGEPVKVTDSVVAEYTASETVRSWGYRRFHRAEDGVLLTDLAVQACEQALKAASVDAAEVDLVVLAIADFAEYLCWDAAAAVQGRIGAVNAEAMLINQACSSGTIAFDAVAGRFATHPDYHNALIVSANRVCDTYQNRMDSTTTVLSDGAAAALVRRGHQRVRWLATEIITDGRYADFFRMDVGGTARPFGTAGAAGPEGLRVRNPLDRLGELLDNDARRMLEFVRTFGGNMRLAVDRVCARTATDVSEIKRFIHLNDNRKAAADIARALGVPLDRLTNDLALDHGHFGAADQLLGLRRLMQAGELQSGDLVALTTLGSGMHWAVTLLRV
ncbi:3-oxoacyl-ACP synthase III family protein [Micromonospora sp. CPCC 205558]|uniref:3-oxoacyl-ACP synthase III family protein n=1 Tax=Micromonospora sp. CPCC 205558 TaxID=3122403 RepID=UPI002FF30E03